MTAGTLSNGVDDFTPELRLGFESANESQNIEHKHLDGSMGHTLRADEPRSGTLRLFFTTAAAAATCRTALVQPAVWTWVDASVEETDLTFVRHGNLGTVQQDARLRWVLDVGFREVLS
jgi:hypothetical protein